MIFQKIAILPYCYIADNKKNNSTIQQYNNRKPQEGFTLIELMVAISITAVLGTLGVAGFVNYNKIQVLQASSSEVVAMLNLAKSRAQSQIKPSALCVNGNNLDGYSVVFSENRKYTLYLRCSVGSSIIEKKINEQDKVLPLNLNFDSNPTFFFPVQTGGVQAPGRIVVCSSNGKAKTISVNSLGGVSMQPSICTFALAPTPTLTPAPTPTFIPTPTPTIPPSSVAVHLYIDFNRNSEQDAGEANASSIKLQLRNSSRTYAQAGTTDTFGNYIFTSLPNDNYVIGLDPSVTGYALFGINFNVPAGWTSNHGLLPN